MLLRKTLWVQEGYRAIFLTWRDNVLFERATFFLVQPVSQGYFNSDINNTIIVDALLIEYKFY